MISVELKTKPRIKRWLRDNEIDTTVVEICLNIILNRIRDWVQHSQKYIEIKKYKNNGSGYYQAENKLQTKPEVLHAESNALMKLAKSTNSSKDSTIYSPESAPSAWTEKPEAVNPHQEPLRGEAVEKKRSEVSSVKIKMRKIQKQDPVRFPVRFLSVLRKDHSIAQDEV